MKKTVIFLILTVCVVVFAAENTLIPHSVPHPTGQSCNDCHKGQMYTGGGASGQLAQDIFEKNVRAYTEPAKIEEVMKAVQGEGKILTAEGKEVNFNLFCKEDNSTAPYATLKYGNFDSDGHVNLRVVMGSGETIDVNSLAGTFTGGFITCYGANFWKDCKYHKWLVSSNKIELENVIKDNATNAICLSYKLCGSGRTASEDIYFHNSAKDHVTGLLIAAINAQGSLSKIVTSSKDNDSNVLIRQQSLACSPEAQAFNPDSYADALKVNNYRNDIVNKEEIGLVQMVTSFHDSESIPALLKRGSDTTFGVPLSADGRATCTIKKTVDIKLSCPSGFVAMGADENRSGFNSYCKKEFSQSELLTRELVSKFCQVYRSEGTEQCRDRSNDTLLGAYIGGETTFSIEKATYTPSYALVYGVDRECAKPSDTETLCLTGCTRTFYNPTIGWQIPSVDDNGTLRYGCDSDYVNCYYRCSPNPNTYRLNEPFLIGKSKGDDKISLTIPTVATNANTATNNTFYFIVKVIKAKEWAKIKSCSIKLYDSNNNMVAEESCDVTDINLINAGVEGNARELKAIRVSYVPQKQYRLELDIVSDKEITVAITGQAILSALDANVVEVKASESPACPQDCLLTEELVCQDALCSMAWRKEGERMVVQDNPQSLRLDNGASFVPYITANGRFFTVGCPPDDRNCPLADNELHSKPDDKGDAYFYMQKTFQCANTEDKKQTLLDNMNFDNVSNTLSSIKRDSDSVSFESQGTRYSIKAKPQSSCSAPKCRIKGYKTATSAYGDGTALPSWSAARLEVYEEDRFCRVLDITDPLHPQYECPINTISPIPSESVVSRSGINGCYCELAIFESDTAKAIAGFNVVNNIIKSGKCSIFDGE